MQRWEELLIPPLQRISQPAAGTEAVLSSSLFTWHFASAFLYRSVYSFSAFSFSLSTQFKHSCPRKVSSALESPSLNEF